MNCPRCGEKMTGKELRYVERAGKQYGPYRYYGHGRGYEKGRKDNFPVKWCYGGKATIQPTIQQREEPSTACPSLDPSDVEELKKMLAYFVKGRGKRRAEVIRKILQPYTQPTV